MCRTIGVTLDDYMANVRTLLEPGFIAIADQSKRLTEQTLLVIKEAGVQALTDMARKQRRERN